MQRMLTSMGGMRIQDIMSENDYTTAKNNNDVDAVSAYVTDPVT